jgi:hypothetical protein
MEVVVLLRRRDDVAVLLRRGDDVAVLRRLDEGIFLRLQVPIPTFRLEEGLLVRNPNVRRG